jgi:hypothetical protein
LFPISYGKAHLGNWAYARQGMEYQKYECQNMSANGAQKLAYYLLVALTMYVTFGA